MTTAIPSSIRSFTALIDYHAQTRPEHPALICGDRTLSYLGLQASASRLTTALSHHGVGAEDRVGVLAKNCAEFVELLLACSNQGAVCVGLNWRLAAAELKYIINDCQAGILFVSREFAPLLHALAPELPALQQVVIIDGNNDQTSSWPSLAQWLDDAPTSPAPEIKALDPHSAPDRAIVQLYTSGTTGNPKGVVLPQRAFFDPWQFENDARLSWNDWGDDDVSLLVMPLFHVGGVGLLCMALRGGATTVIEAEFNPVQVMTLVPEHRITKSFLVPAAIRALILTPGAQEADWSSLRLMLYGAAPMPESLLLEAMQTLGCEFAQQYGMTELCGTVVHLPTADHVPGSPRLRAAGLPLPGTTINIIDDQGRPLPANKVGEIIVKSPAVMLGYYGLPEATQKTLVAGYIHTGDAGYFDDDGYLYIFDRMKDMIISGGENVYPIEVENVLYKHPAVTDAAVIGVPDERWGEAVLAVIVLADGQSIEADQLIAYCKQHLAAFKCPKRVAFVTELPRNPSGKILKKSLREPYWQGQQRRV
ncbi:long-chain-fatty-acid--CoA ligase [Spongiibacter taiwanensis]|uniref:long-chain-fatty-acid--CoA ligase n=1 Tax=Spongiibacter taiwanensis TaxID=1748242 RepID=UPI00203594E6|nr:long-chain-fatty-acid--CoA ligase [Spongiibacter taiwanensis]USA44035.1 long-chain-fatty-acid--CoA ligase [Spongiibacter taiwanensis]